MPGKDLDKTRSRLLDALRRTMTGLELQRQRLADYRAGLEVIPVEGHEQGLTVHTKAGDCDADYYAYELGRLQAIARTTRDEFGQPQEIVDALAAFDAAVPGMRAIRNPLTHPGGDARLDDVAWFGAHARLHPDGRVEYLVDSRYEHHDAAVALGATIMAWLRRGLRS